MHVALTDCIQYIDSTVSYMPMLAYIVVYAIGIDFPSILFHEFQIRQNPCFIPLRILNKS